MDKRPLHEQKLFDAKRRDLQRLAGLLNESEMEMAPMAPIAEDGLAAMAPDAHPGYPELDGVINDIGLAVRNVVLKLMAAHGLTDDQDPDMPFKAEYVMNGVIDHLKTETI